MTKSVYYYDISVVQNDLMVTIQDFSTNLLETDLLQLNLWMFVKDLVCLGMAC